MRRSLRAYRRDTRDSRHRFPCFIRRTLLSFILPWLASAAGQDMSREMAKLKFVGKETADNTVPVDVLVRALQGMQQTALLLAASVEQRAVQQRFRPSEE